MASLDLDNPTDEQRLAVQLLERAWKERDSALARVKDLEMLLGYSREGVKIWTEACERVIGKLSATQAALVEALDWATPFDGRHDRSGGYSSELLPMFVRIGERRREERLAELRKLEAQP